MWVTSSYKNDRFPSCPQLRIRPHFYSPFPQFSSSENLKSWRRTFSARSKRSVSRHPLDRSPRERSSTFRRVPPPPPPPPPIRSIHDRDSDRETLKERPDLPVKIFHPLRHDLCPREHTMWKNKRLDDADVTDGRCRCRDFERTSLRTSSFLCRKIEFEGGFESFARSDESSWKRRKKKKMTLFLSLSLVVVYSNRTTLVCTRYWQDISWRYARTWRIHIYVGGVTRVALRTPSSNKLTDPIKKSRE